MYLIIDFQVGLDIRNCIAFYSSAEENLIARLRRDYDGICFNGNLILRVLHTIRVSECMLLDPTAPTVGSLSVIFRALVVNYAPGDVIAGCIVRPIRDHGRITMVSEHACTMIVQMKDDRDLTVLDTGAVVSVFAIGVLASPGSSQIAVQANLYEPQNITKFYPIIPGTISQIESCEAMTREKYAALPEVVALIGTFPTKSAPTAPGEVIHGCTVRRAAQSAREWFGEVKRETSSGESASLPNIIQKLFYPFREDRSAPKSLVEVIDLVSGTPALPPDTTCLVACSEINPLSGFIGVCKIPIANLPPEWIAGELAQPAGVVIARRLERFIDYALAGATMTREFTDKAKISASKNLILLQSGKKT